VARSRESIWLALAGGLGGAGGVLLGISAAFGAATKGYSVWTSVPAIVAYIVFGLAVACLACAAYDMPIPLPGRPPNAEPPVAVPLPSPITSVGGAVVVGNIPQQPPGFQPRADLLADLDRAGAEVSVVHAVTGMRGVGKTQLAAAYARAKLADGWRLVAWVSAEDTASLLAGLAEVVEAAGLTSQGAGDPGLVVRHWLETDSDRRLVVFDNATDPDVLRPYLPASGGARVLITSNRQSVANLGTRVGVEVFTLEEALAFLADRTGLADPADAGVVAAELGYLPLALAQAAAVIAGQHLTYGTYLERLKTLPVAEYLVREPGEPYPRGVAEAVLLSLEAVRAGDRSAVCAAVMELVAVLSPAGIRRALVHEAARQGVLERDGQPGELSSEVVDRALARLAGASLLTFSVDGSSVTAHRLVMRVIREQLAAGNSLVAVCAAGAQLLEERAESFRRTWYEDRGAVRDLVEQIMALYESSAVCPADGDLVHRMLGLRVWAVWFLNELGDSAVQSILVGEPLLADHERVLGADHLRTMDTRNNLAAAYREAGRTAEAITLHEQNLADRERVLGADHPDTLTTRNNLAAAYQDAGRTAEAITLYEQTLADRKRVLGADHPHPMDTRNNLAAAYQAADRITEAITLHEQNLADRERVLGADHPQTLATRNNLAVAYQAADRTGEAITLHEQTLADRERVLGADHPDTLATRNNLAVAYQAADRTGEAITLHEQNLADRERVLGTDHPQTLATRNNLADAYRAAGRADLRQHVAPDTSDQVMALPALPGCKGYFYYRLADIPSGSPCARGVEDIGVGQLAPLAAACPPGPMRQSAGDDRTTHSFTPRSCPTCGTTVPWILTRALRRGDIDSRCWRSTAGASAGSSVPPSSPVSRRTRAARSSISSTSWSVRRREGSLPLGWEPA
jgi:tetratricopeptide (TPR) repeat protein